MPDLKPMPYYEVEKCLIDNKPARRWRFSGNTIAFMFEHEVDAAMQKIHLTDAECAAEKWKAKWLSKHLMDASTGKGVLGDIGPTLISRELALQVYARAKVLERFATLPHAHEDVS